ncbi:haloacid dehalogenase type II [Roseomonas sp. M0104]|uniref:Haloacid dehalogenase type II n=1 Tax=Teichococcus coralli TaxID=2545983 RepID=A0A845BMK2_9PROT|nr:haloacid dehalogenase type II [Pseudoroseomonas coralli]MXP64639.1 haloacid dehalogenase type II [Pseudoroseomonas coralli]
MSRLHDFRVLTFDCYGTLIDWESGIYDALQPLLRRGGLDLPRDAVLEAFAHHESAQQAETPAMRYAELLSQVHHRLADEWGIEPDEAGAVRFGASVPDWPAFPDSAGALAYLKRHYMLVILSNVDHASFAGSRKRLGVAFDAVYTAEEIGSYKPDPRNFRFMLTKLGAQGFGRGEILHVAQSLFHDHAPAKRVGLASAWIDRRHGQEGWGATMPPPSGAGYEFRFASLAEMVAAHQADALA